MKSRIRRRIVRQSFRVILSVAFFVATSPQADVLAEERSGRSTPIDRVEMLRKADAATVKIRAVRKVGSRRQTSHGAGVVVSADGYCLTANHVIDGFNEIFVTTVEGDVLPGKVVLVEFEYDIAMLKIKPDHPLEFANFADPSHITPGVKVAAIGNPAGMGQQIVSGTIGDVTTVSWDGHRAPLRGVNADIVQGNSGGGTFDLSTGELLGINVAKSSAKSRAGYMVPVDRLVAIIDRKLPIMELADSQEIYAQLGVKLRKVRLIEGKFNNGLLVTAIRAGSAAERAGWQVGDVLVGMDKYKMVDQDAVLWVLRDEKRDNTQVSFLMARGDAVDTGIVDLQRSAGEAASTRSTATLVSANY